MTKRLFLCFIGLISLFSFVGCNSDLKVKKIELNISVASSLKDSMLEVKEKYEELNENIELTINYGSSGSLKQQIENGAPCDLFISAGKIQIEELNNNNILISNTVRNLLKNELVLVSNTESKLKDINDLKNKNVNHIGIGNPESVPVGKYADETLKCLNLQDKISNKLVYAKDAKEVLAWTQSGNVEAGFIYFSDTVKNKKIKIIQKINEDNHSEIIYPMGIVKGSKNIEQTKKFQKFLLNEECKKIFIKYGYKQI